MNKSDPIINSNTILFKVLNRGSLDNKIFIFYDKKFEKSRIMVDKGLGHTWRIDAFQTILIEYNWHLKNRSPVIYHWNLITNILLIDYLVSKFTSVSE